VPPFRRRRLDEAPFARGRHGEPERHVLPHRVATGAAEGPAVPAGVRSQVPRRLVRRIEHDEDVVLRRRTRRDGGADVDRVGHVAQAERDDGGEHDEPRAEGDGRAAPALLEDDPPERLDQQRGRRHEDRAGDDRADVERFERDRLGPLVERPSEDARDDDRQQQERGERERDDAEPDDESARERDDRVRLPQIADPVVAVVHGLA
jgi:hypothetical protein